MNFKKWKTYFLQNRNHFDHIQWNDVSTLIPEENHLITSSIQQVQRANIPNNAGITLVDGEKDPKKNYNDDNKPSVYRENFCNCH